MKNYNQQNFFKEVKPNDFISKGLIAKITLFIYFLISGVSTKAQFNELKTTSHADEIPSDKESYTLDISSWIAGQYTIKVMEDKELISTNKLTVIK